MGPRTIVAGSTNVSTVIRIVDSADGTPETGVVAATPGLSLSYRLDGATVTSISLSNLSTAADAHSDGGLIHLGNGWYRLDLPDAAVAEGETGVLILGTATGMIVLSNYIQLADAVQDAFISTVVQNSGFTNTIDVPAFAAYAAGDLTGEVILLRDVSTGLSYFHSVTDSDTLGTLTIYPNLAFTPQDNVDLLVRLGRVDAEHIGREVHDYPSATSLTAGSYGELVKSMDANIDTIDGIVDALTTNLATVDTNVDTLLTRLQGVIIGTVGAGTNGTTTFSTTLTAPTANCWANRRVIMAASGSGAPQQAGIIATNTAGANASITLDTSFNLQSAPTSGDTLLIT